MSRKATAGRPGVPGAFSGPSKGARWLHNSSGICHIVGTAVLVNIASLPYSWEVYPIKIALSGFRTDSKYPACSCARVSQLWDNVGETHCCLCLKSLSLSVLILYQLSLITASL